MLHVHGTDDRPADPDSGQAIVVAVAALALPVATLLAVSHPEFALGVAVTALAVVARDRLVGRDR
ncbi:MAG: hypothetical protein ABEJ79_03385 [Halolamina sp.]